MEKAKSTKNYVEKEICKACMAFSSEESVTISRFLKKINLEVITKKYRYSKFTNVAMQNAVLFMKLKKIKSQTQLVKYLKNNKEDALNLGFDSGRRNSIPDQRTVSHFMNNILDEETKTTIDSTVQKIEEIAEKYGIVFDTEVLKEKKPCKRGTKKTNYNRIHNKLHEVCKYIKKNIYPHITLNMRHNAQYSKNTLLNLLVHMALNGDFAEDGSKTFRETVKYRTPDADTLLYHIEKYEDINAVQDMFLKAFEIIYKIAKTANMFPRKVDVAIDYTDWYYYGNKNDYMVVEKKPEKGTSHCFRFATIIVVEAGERFTLLALPVGKFDSKEKIVRKLIEYTRGKININKAYFDRGFFSIDVINLLKELGVNFIMPAIENKDIERHCNAVSAPFVVKDYVMGTKPEHSASFNLGIMPKKINGRELKIPFATNIKITQNEVCLAEKLFNLYSKRWGIETSYRVKKAFRPKTTSKNYIVRLFYFLFSTLVYNLWIIVNILVGNSLMKKLPEKPHATAKLFGTVLYLITEPT